MDLLVIFLGLGLVFYLSSCHASPSCLVVMGLVVMAGASVLSVVSVFWLSCRFLVYGTKLWVYLGNILMVLMMFLTGVCWSVVLSIVGALGMLVWIFLSCSWVWVLCYIFHLAMPLVLVLW